MSIEHITAENFTAEVLESDRPVLLDFWADWCGPCKMIAPILEKLSEERPDVKFCKANVDETPELAAEFMVSSIPAVFLIERGEVVDELIGARPKEQYLELLNLL